MQVERFAISNIEKPNRKSNCIHCHSPPWFTIYSHHAHFILSRFFDTKLREWRSPQSIFNSSEEYFIEYAGKYTHTHTHTYTEREGGKRIYTDKQHIHIIRTFIRVRRRHRQCSQLECTDIVSKMELNMRGRGIERSGILNAQTSPRTEQKPTP